MVRTQAQKGGSLTRHDFLCYAQKNKDLVNALGKDIDKLRTHWFNSGSKEGRPGPGPCRLLDEPVTAVTAALGPTINLPCRLQAHECKSNAASRRMPMLGFGTCCRASAQGPALVASVLDYVASGGRLIDTAQLYGNHKDIARAIGKLPLKREDLWITTKLNTEGCCPAGHTTYIRTEQEVLSSVQMFLGQLKVKYIDLLLQHHASPEIKERVDLWKNMIVVQEAGLVRNIGVSNYGSRQMQELFEATGVMPSVNQIEFHPWVPAGRYRLLRWCHDHGVIVTAFGSLGGYGNHGDGGDVVGQLARRYGLTSSQLLLQWAIQQGVAVIPGATSQSHIEENLKLGQRRYNISLSHEDLTLIRNSPKPKHFKLWMNYEDDHS